MKHKNHFIIFSFLVLLLAACPTGNGPKNDSSKNDDSKIDDPKNDTKPAKVYFVNHSSYQADIYKNFNPLHFDPTTLVCTVSAGETKMIEQYSSFDQIIGDTFYPHYKIKLADIITPGITKNIDIDAQRLLINITFVIKNGESYTKLIPQPNKGELDFFHGYIEIQNQGTSQIQIIRAGSPLLRLDNSSIYINPGHIGFFEIEFSSSSAITMNQLKAFGDNYYDFPVFTAERGKLYRFIFKNDNSVVWNNPDIKNLDPLSN